MNTPEGGRITERRLSLIESELDTLYEVSRLLSKSLELDETLTEILKLLHEQQAIKYGMVGLIDEDSGDLHVHAMHEVGSNQIKDVTYHAGEGVVGLIMENRETVVVPKIAEEPRFLGKTKVYDRNLPFIGVPIFLGDKEPVGVLAAQPPEGVGLLGERARFLEMISGMIAQTLRLCRAIKSERQQLKDERDNLRRAVKGEHGFDNMVGHNDAIRLVFEQVRMVSKWNTTVLIRGESGTGKELVANAIHYNSPRVNDPFVKLNCAALPDNLLESELFGHEKGAFTGATTQRKGRFEMADGGTLFLDEIGEITPAFQAKLLRVLQEGEFERVGGTKTIKVNVRIIAATNVALEEAVEAGDFREDLYYRLNVMPIVMPPLRERLEDIPYLARHLCQRIGEKQGRPLDLTDAAIRKLSGHSWPGNVRELENCLERASIMSPSGEIDAPAIAIPDMGMGGMGGGMGAGMGGVPQSARPGMAPVAPPSPQPSPQPVPQAPAGSMPYGGPSAPAPAPRTKVDLNDPNLSEKERVVAALEEAGWVQAKAARLLNMTPRQIAYRIQTLNIEVRQI